MRWKRRKRKKDSEEREEKRKKKREVLVISVIPSYCDTKYYTDRRIYEIFQPSKTIAVLWNTHYLAGLFELKACSYTGVLCTDIQTTYDLSPLYKV